MLILSYKAMKRDLPGTVRTIASFLDLNVGQDVLDLVCEKSSFQYMKGIGQKFGGWNSIPWRTEAAMMRRGDHGASSEILTPARQRAIDDFFVADLARLGSDLPYAQFADIAGDEAAAS